jgi:ankyrin repeat protein
MLPKKNEGIVIGSFDTLIQQNSHAVPSAQGVTLLADARSKIEDGHTKAARTKLTQSIEAFRLALASKSHCRASREGLAEAWELMGELRPDYAKDHFPQVNWADTAIEEGSFLNLGAFKAFLADTFIEGEWKQQCDGKFGGYKPEGKSWRRFYLENENVFEKFDNLADKVKWAVEYGHHHLLNFLLKTTEDLKEIDGSEEFPLLQVAVAKEYKKVVALLLDKGANINARSKKSKWSVLHWAAYRGNRDLLCYLMDNGAKINLSDRDGLTPLHVASYRGISEIVRLLVDRKAKLNQADKDGYVPVHLAVMRNHWKAVEILIEAGADVRKTDPYKRTILHWSVLIGSNQITDLILKKNTLASVKDDFDRIPLHWAAQSGHVDMVDSLIRAKSKINDVDKYGDKPMVIAAFFGHSRVVSSLFEKEKC